MRLIGSDINAFRFDGQFEDYTTTYNEIYSIFLSAILRSTYIVTTIYTIV